MSTETSEEDSNNSEDELEDEATDTTTETSEEDSSNSEDELEDEATDVTTETSEEDLNNLENEVQDEEASHILAATNMSTEKSEGDFNNLEDELQIEEVPHVLSGTDKLVETLKDIFLSGEFHDTIIKVKDEEFQAHKLILVARSPVFASMFRHDMIERRTGVVTIEDCEPKAFKEFLLYLYSGKLENVSTENVLDLYYIADKYDVEEVRDGCVKFMINNFSVDNFCDFISLALLHGEKRLIKSTTDYFIKNVKNIIVTVSWQCFYTEHPVESNELYIKAIMHLVPD